MANAADEKAMITENLTDIGLDASSVSHCIDMLEKGMYSDLERFLSLYRRELLDRVHEYNKRIDCLDYFTYKLTKRR